MSDDYEYNSRLTLRSIRPPAGGAPEPWSLKAAWRNCLTYGSSTCNDAQLRPPQGATSIFQKSFALPCIIIRDRSIMHHEKNRRNHG